MHLCTYLNIAGFTAHKKIFISPTGELQNSASHFVFKSTVIKCD